MLPFRIIMSNYEIIITVYLLFHSSGNYCCCYISSKMDSQAQSLPIIEIPLKPANAGTVLPSNINEIVQTEYAQQYLQNISATPSAKNIEYLLARMPLSESLVVPVWTRELIAIVPGMNAKDAEATNVMSDIFK